MRDQGSRLHRRRLTLAAALLWSLLAHLFLVGGAGLPLARLFPADDDLLSSRPPGEVQRIRLAVPRPPAPETTPPAGLRLTLAPPSPRPSSATPLRRPAPVVSRPSRPSPRHAPAPPASPPMAPTALAPAPDNSGATATADALEALPPLPTTQDPAPAFPVQLSARLAASVGNRDLSLRQEWWMEGYRYVTTLSGSRLGLQLQASSEGVVAAEGGLQPERSLAIVGGSVRSLTEASEGLIRFGRPGQLREVALPVVVQDMMSLPFHLAVTFDGTPRTLLVSSGQSVQQYRFTPVAEETLRLPAGRLRALHLRGEYYDHHFREMTPIVDVWLGIDYLNFPVKVSGHLKDGLPFEYRLDALEIEGVAVLDSARPELARGSDDAIPGRLRSLRQQGLKNP